MAFEGFFTRILQVAKGLKPQYPIVPAGGTRGPKVHKWPLKGSLLVFLQVAKGLKPQYPLLRLAEPKAQGAQMASEGFLTRIFTSGEGFEAPIPHCYGWRNPKAQGAQNGN
ncbi:Hypothetical protein FKW44_004209 [Caligus rogercresseyi]|uniref:Uncharacterized protein n=1 Tax=Caligus rogercresseyi TaxID=217165 RepID=A0A7T8HLL7_CALRO|nr:Hypothetical protein FKW44_004209 [Caligus rogercresseyi]